MRTGDRAGTRCLEGVWVPRKVRLEGSAGVRLGEVSNARLKGSPLFGGRGQGPD